MSRRPFRRHRDRFTVIQRQLRNSNRLFEDKEFPATNKSLFTRRGSVQLIWRRPHEIVKSPQFISRGFSRTDVAQGRIQNCWFVAALANLSSNLDLLKQVCSSDQSFDNGSYCGMFRFNFWRFGEWVEVIVDDYLPTYNNKLYFTRSDDPNEFWSALLEKAYAKVCGSYEAMCLGHISEALQDFTGGMIESIDLKSPPPDLYNVMLKAHYRQSLMGCSIEVKQQTSGEQYEDTLDNGLITRHAYSITGLCRATLKSFRGRPEVDLIRIRNPHGNDSEWKGAWSDRSSEWNMLSSRERKRLNLTFDDDGEFWMSFDDFMSNFTRLEICMLSPDSLLDIDRKQWDVLTETGRWQRGASAGGCRNFIQTFHTNPQYRVELKDPDEGDDDDMCTIVISLMRVDRSKRRAVQDLPPIGFAIYKAPDDLPKNERCTRSFFEYNKSVVMTNTFSKLREVSCRYTLPAGEYIVVPSTFEPGQESEFLIRIFSEKPHETSEIDQETKMTVAPKVVITQDDIKNIDAEFWDVFHETAGEDGEVDQYELQDILSQTYQQELNANPFCLEACRSMISMFDTDRSGALGYNEFRALRKLLNKWTKHFHLYDRDKSGDMNAYELREALNGLGYQLSNSALGSVILRYHNKRGTIPFDTFIQIVVRVVVMFDTFKKQCDRNGGSSTRTIFSIDQFIDSTLTI